MSSAASGPLGRALSRALGDERLRFLLVGGLNTAVGYGLFALVQWSVGRWISYFASLLIAHLCASLLAFVLYRRLVFRVSGNVVIDFLRFQTVYLIPLASNLILLPILVAGLGWNVYLAQASIVIVTTVVSFLGHKYFSFRRARHEQVEADAAATGSTR